MVATIKKTPAKLTTGAIIDKLWACREEKRLLAAQLKEVEARIEETQEQLLERFDTEGMISATGTKASASVTPSVIAKVEDWDEFWAFVIKKKYTHMLQKRVSDPAYRELLEKGVKVPGVVPFNKKTVNLRTVAAS